jgi:hypothetical protein
VFRARTAPAPATASSALSPAVAASPESEAALARAKAYDVYERFVAHGAAFEINLSADCARPLHAEFAQHFELQSGLMSASAKGDGINLAAVRERTAASAKRTRAPSAVPEHAPLRHFARVTPEDSVPAKPNPFASPPTQPADFYWRMFDVAAREIHVLLENDSYPRYIHSPLFLQLCLAAGGGQSHTVTVDPRHSAISNSSTHPPSTVGLVAPPSHSSAAPPTLTGSRPPARNGSWVGAQLWGAGPSSTSAPIALSS